MLLYDFIHILLAVSNSPWSHMTPPKQAQVACDIHDRTALALGSCTGDPVAKLCDHLQILTSTTAAALDLAKSLRSRRGRILV